MSECLASVGDSFGVDVAGGSPGGDFLPVGPGQHPLGREHLDMLLAAWGATAGGPAFISSAVSSILGSAPRSFRQWVAGHAAAFTAG